jgi:hypothetical protein
LCVRTKIACQRHGPGHVNIRQYDLNVRADFQNRQWRRRHFRSQEIGLTLTTPHAEVRLRVSPQTHRTPLPGGDREVLTRSGGPVPGPQGMPEIGSQEVGFTVS